MPSRYAFKAAPMLVLAVLQVSCCGTGAMRYEAMYLDLDGTALGSDHHVVASVSEAVSLYRECGGRIGIATGRILEQADEAIDVLDPELPVVLFNGCVVFDPISGSSEVLASLDAETLAAVKPVLDLDESVFGYILHYASSSVGIGDPAHLDALSAEASIALVDRPTNDEASVIKILVFCPSAHASQLLSTLRGVLPLSARAVISSPEQASLQTLEVLPANANKATAISHALRSYGMSIADVIAFGDSGNDIEMLEQVGFGVAMGNGRKETKEASDAIIGVNDSDAIRRFVVGMVLARHCGLAPK
jgi:Cof subfamily protein (haloacid dehalogenase superfamily)